LVIQREIKFRAWLPGISKMTYSHTLEELMNWDTKPEDNGTAIWLEYTGVDDICEGDIIEHMDSISLKLIISEVYWNERGYWAVRKKGKVFENLLWRTENPRVIGNIYENVELLE
jgi:hypothetical protein